jgi:cyclopropane-fatty-acyl-phospholipid synthase
VTQTTGAAAIDRFEADARGIQFHYDLPTAFFQLFLDPTMSYSCHYFLTPDDTLAQAAINKLNLVARKINLSAADRVLDVGCGWGSFVLWAAAEYGCRTVGITLSPSQAAYVREQADARGIGDRVEVLVMHANAMTFPDAGFDKIVTVGAIEHIADLDGLWRDCRRLLRPEPDARLLAHGMTVPVAARRTEETPEALSGESSFIGEYIFPVGQFTHLVDVIRPLETNDFEVLDVENISDHYTQTLRHWYDNLMTHAADLGAATGVAPERFRAQALFLAGCAAAFSENRILCYQTLARPIAVDMPREPLPATRRAFIPCGYPIAEGSR